MNKPNAAAQLRAVLTDGHNGPLTIGRGELATILDTLDEAMRAAGSFNAEALRYRDENHQLKANLLEAYGALRQARDWINATRPASPRIADTGTSNRSRGAVLAAIAEALARDEPPPCPHPPADLYAWFAIDDTAPGGRMLCVACKACKAVLQGGASLDEEGPGL